MIQLILLAFLRPQQNPTKHTKYQYRRISGPNPISGGLSIATQFPYLGMLQKALALLS
jgi:hypothetical protein